MAQLVTEICDRCEAELIFDRKLGNRSAGPVEITLPAGGHELGLCSSCMTELVDWIGVRPFTSSTGLLAGQEKLFYLEIVDDGAKPPTKLRPVEPPKFGVGPDEEDERYWDQ